MLASGLTFPKVFRDREKSKKDNINQKITKTYLYKILGFQLNIFFLYLRSGKFNKQCNRNFKSRVVPKSPIPKKNGIRENCINNVSKKKIRIRELFVYPWMPYMLNE